MRKADLKDAFSIIRNGLSIKQTKEQIGYPISRIETISKGKIDLTKCGYASLTDSTKYKEWFLVDGDILMSHINSVEHLGKTGIYEAEHGQIIHGMNLLCLRCNPITLPKYAFYFFNSSHFVNQLPKITNKSVNQASFSITKLKTLKIPLPPLPIQRQIAQVLDQADALRQRHRRILQKYDQLAQSVFLEMFGDPVRNPRGWSKQEISKLGKISTGNTPSRKRLDYYDNNFVEWIKTDNIVEDQLFVTKASEYLSEEGANAGRIIPKNSLLVACIAGSIKSVGRAALTNKTVAFNQQINAVQPNENIAPLFIYWLFKLSRDYIQDHASRGMKKILTKSEFSKIVLINPPLSLQNQFAQIIQTIETQKQQQQHALDKSEELFQSLLQRAFRGELFTQQKKLSQQMEMF